MGLINHANPVLPKKTKQQIATFSVSPEISLTGSLAFVK
jgi:hypothetical protein